MALHIIRNKFKIYKGEKSAEPKFRVELSKILLEKFGRGPHTQEEIQEILRCCLDFHIEKFREICMGETSYFFYQNVLMFHEEAVELAVKEKGKTHSNIITGEYLAVYRRILKFNLETGCEVKMKIVQPQKKDRERIERLLDDLLFLGDMILMSVSIYAEQGMIEDVGEIYFDKNDLYVFTRRHHYNTIFDYINEELGHAVEKMIIDEDGFEDLAKALKSCIGVSYHDAGSVVAAINEQLHFTGGFGWESLPTSLETYHGVPYEKGELFFKGLTLSRDNKMSLLDLACKPNNLRRYLYRPIIIWNINDNDFAFCGPHAWTETIIQFTTNALPWGKGPEEWMGNKCFRDFVNRKEDAHDKWLDDAVELQLKESNVYYDRNVTGLHTNAGYVNIDVKGLGEIDFIIIAHDVKKIFITDCKHLMSRYDAANQKNDFNAFTKGSKKTKSYNQTMTAKLEWFNVNKNILEEHFAIKNKLGKLPLTEYRIEGMFIINTPTLYMYNADYRIYTLNQVSAVLNGTYQDQTFVVHSEDENSTSLMHIKYPYFKKPKLLTIDPFDDDSDEQDQSGATEQ